MNFWPFNKCKVRVGEARAAVSDAMDRFMTAAAALDDTRIIQKTISTPVNLAKRPRHG